MVNESRNQPLERWMGKIETTVSALQDDLAAKHKENRASIHGLRNDQQKIINSSYERNAELLEVLGSLKALPDLITKLNNRVDATVEDVTDLKIRWARLTGYVLGVGGAAGGVAGTVFELVKWIAH